jgi:outer membrane receptor for ferrienterochelin and colicin
MRTALLLLLGLAALVPLSAQSLKGKVFGELETGREILPGATVAWIGTSRGTAANDNGVFELSLEGIKDKRIVVSYVGFIPDTAEVGELTYLSVTLVPDAAVLGDVTITGRRSGAYISDLSPIKTEVITQKELTKAACCDLAGCFETQATVQPQTTNVLTNSKELRILGLSGVYNQVLFDGMPLIQGLTYTYGISTFPGSVVDNIYVSKGANSVLQGFESLSGQINVEPRMPDETDQVFVNLYLNTFGETHVNANVAVPVGREKKWSTLLAFHTVQPAGTFDRDEDTFLDLPMLTRYMLYNRWTYGNDQERGWFAHIGGRMLFEERVGGQLDFDPASDKGSAEVYGQVVGFTQPEVYTKTGYRFNDDHALTVMASAFFQDQRTWFGTLQYDAEQVNAYLNVQHEYVWADRHLLKYGLSYRFQDLDETIRFSENVPPRTYAGTYTLRQRIPGLFAENAFHWQDDKIVWIAGARLDHHQDFGWFFTPRTLLKYSINAAHTVRASIGTGWRQVNLFSENINLLASSRDVIFEEALDPEQGFNWGVNYTWKFAIGSTTGSLSGDYYQTRFSSQFFPDYDTDPTKAFIRNFTGTSVSNAAQVEASMLFWETFEVRTAYNFLDVYRMEDGARNVLPFNPRNRLMAALSYRPRGDRWYFDVNGHWYGEQRLPDTGSNPPEYQTAPYSDPYVLVNGQVTFRTGQFELYAGMENIFDFRQLQPIVSWQEPFGPYFDTSSVWGPTRGREGYVGVRWRLARKD